MPPTEHSFVCLLFFSLKEKKYTFLLLVCYSQLSDMHSLSHPQCGVVRSLPYALGTFYSSLIRPKDLG